MKDGGREVRADHTKSRIATAAPCSDLQMGTGCEKGTRTKWAHTCEAVRTGPANQGCPSAVLQDGSWELDGPSDKRMD